MILSTSEILNRLPLPELLPSLAKFAEQEGLRLYLVGGTVRDLFMGREIDDLDFSLEGDAVGFAQKFGEYAGAKVITLDDEQGTARVIFSQQGFYMDFSKIRGENIVCDLGARDFTINAMALDFNRLMNSHEIEIIDPYNGMDGLNNRLIRNTSPQNISSDPLRMLRAYRFASTLNFSIDSDTTVVISDSVSLLDSISAERVRDELFKILSVQNSLNYLRDMDEVGLLKVIFPEIVRMKGMKQNDYHHLDVWEHSLLTLEFFESDPVPYSMRRYADKIDNYLNNQLVKDRLIRSLLKLTALLHDVGKPAVRTMDTNGRIRFFDHHIEGSEVIKDIGIRLKLAKREIAFLSKVIKNHMYPLSLMVYLRYQGRSRERNRAIRRFIHRTSDECIAVLLISFADLRATQGPRRRDDDLVNLDRLIGEIAGIYFQELQSPMPKLVKGEDIMAEFNLPESPIIGEILKKIETAQIDGLVKTRSEAMAIARNVLSHRNDEN